MTTKLKDKDDVKDLDELGYWIIAQINKNLSKSNEVVGFVFNVHYSDNVPNTHYSPVNKPTNWARKNPDLPTGYPGYQGRVWLRLKNPNKAFVSDRFYNTLTHTGTGGFGSYDGIWHNLETKIYQKYNRTPPKNIVRPECFSYDYKIFIEDFKGLEASLVFNVLSDTKPKDHVFTWECKKQIARDKEMLKFIEHDDIKELCNV